jgi:serine protease inhibitor
MSEPNANFDHPRIPPPSGDDESMREYGRQLAMDSLLALLLKEPGTQRKGTEEVVGENPEPWKASSRQRPLSPSPASPHRKNRSKNRTRRWMAAVVAASVLVLLAIGGHLWLTSKTPDHPMSIARTEPPVPLALIALAVPWSVEPTGAAEYRVLAPTRIRLDRGELRLVCRSETKGGARASELTVVTPFGTATTKGNDNIPHKINFLIGTHQPQATLRGVPMFSPLTRVLVLTGTVTLANALGSTSGGPGTLLAAEAEKPPANIAVTANSDFGLDLYRQLAKGSPGKNVFFSPYSMSSALAMTAEGARGATAEEMGKALHFPAAARRIGDDAQLLPWNTALIHTGMAELNRQFNGQDKTPPAVRERIAQLRKELADIQKHMNEIGGGRQQTQEFWEVAKKGRETVGELNSLLAQVDQYELRVVNGLWGAKKYPFRQEFLNTLGTHYATGGIASMDFLNDPEAARRKINDWCKEQTNGRIAEPLPTGSVHSDTRLVLANAIYFLGQWANPFDANLTNGTGFTLSTPNGKAPVSVAVPMMHKPFAWTAYAAFNADGSFFETPGMYNPREKDQSKLYPGDRGFLMAEFPYKGGQLAMTVLVPRSPEGLGHLEDLLTPENLRQWLGRLQGREVHVSMPKFKLQTAYKMNDSLKALGMVRAFDETGKADFRGMSTADEPLYLSAVFHKAFVEVNEKGTEAAAFSYVDMSPMGKVMPKGLKHFIPEFKADRPFVFLIRDCKTGTILFLGRVEDPRSGESR